MHIKKFIQYKLAIFFFICLFSLSFCQLANSKQIKTEKVTSWDHGEQVLLYCAVDIPFRNQISSYADAELLWIVPEGSLIKEGDLLAKQDDFHLSQKRKMLDIRIAGTKSKTDKGSWIALLDVSCFISGNMNTEIKFYETVRNFELESYKSGVYDFNFGAKLKPLLDQSGFNVIHCDESRS